LGDRTEVHRTQMLWDHAEARLKSASTDLDLVDAITTLKRAVDLRLRSLARIYQFKKLPVPGKARTPLEWLTLLGCARPLMVSQLIGIRNAVEHEDATPPDRTECVRLCDFVWYFLRSTDHLVVSVQLTLNLNSSEDLSGPYWIEIDWDGAWLPLVRGWLPAEHVSATEVPGFSEVVLGRTETPATSTAFNAGQRLADDVYVSGKVRGPAESVVKFSRLRLTV
jgi:hypothetical protein